MSDIRISTNTNTATAKTSDAGTSQDSGTQDAFSSIMADAAQRNASTAPPVASDAPAPTEPVVKNAKAKSADDKDSKDTKDAKDDGDQDSADAASEATAGIASVIDASAAALVQSLPPPAELRSLQASTSAPTLDSHDGARLGLGARATDLSELGANASASSPYAALAGVKAKPVATAAELLSSAVTSRHGADTSFDADIRAALEHAATMGDKLSANATGATRSELPQLSAAMAALSSAAPTTNASAAQFSVTAPVMSPAFADDLSQRVIFMANQRIQSAEISVNPPDLGPVSVRIDMRGNEASVSFNASNASTRTALQDALPRLQAMFETSGLQLSNASVGSDTRRDAPNSRRDSRAPSGVSAIGAASAVGSIAGAGTAGVSIGARSVRLVDTFV